MEGDLTNAPFRVVFPQVGEIRGLELGAHVNPGPVHDVQGDLQRVQVLKVHQHPVSATGGSGKETWYTLK